MKIKTHYSFVNKVIAVSVLVMLSTITNADSFTSLLMPGPVINGHQEFEQECDQCHDTADKSKQGVLCVECHAHENILDDISTKEGFHGRLPKLEQTDCKHCHTEHKGRNSEIVLLNTSTFNHSNTDFSLKGEHKKVTCNICHKDDKKYSEAPVDCYSCHKKSDVHKGEQGEKCGDCHGSDNWKKTEFDHDKTDFSLEESHKDISCSSCHINQGYKDTPKTCFACHQINDVHKNGYGKKCESCHVESKWDKAHYEHNKKTDFPLYGKHKKTSCNSCHASGDIEKELPTKCYSCHKNDDSHKSRFGKKCNDCHKSSSWQKQKFNHDKDTDFSLLGKHKKTACTQCHKGHLYDDEIKSDCYSCHNNDDVHEGKQGKECGNCHHESDWQSDVLFDHDLVDFPLIGMHATTQCEECHLNTQYEKTESKCNECHSDVDVHKTQLGTDCHTCHTSNAWNIWFFDHNEATDFKINGVHKELGCYDCHKDKSQGKLRATKDCISCHRSDDVHNKRFGRQCGSCHSTKNFKDINVENKW